MNPMVYAIPVFMLSIVAEVWLTQRRGLRAYDTADALTSLHLGLMSQLAGLFLTRLLWVAVYVAAFEGLRLATLPLASPWVWLLALIGYDFCAYWAHRLDHEVNVLWAAHVVHHTSEYFNLSTALRQSSTNAFLHWIFYLPLALVGVPPAVFFTVSLVHLLYQYWVHTQLVGRLGWIDRVFVTPSNHRVHHGQNDYCIDKNYGGMLVLWDRMFGTFAEERPHETIVCGVRKPLHSFNPLWGNLHHYVELFRQTRLRRGLGARLALWFEPPSGPAGSAPPALDVPGFARYASPASTAVRRYALLQYALTLPFVMHLMTVASTLSLPGKALYALGLLATVQCLGALLQGVAGACRFELSRVAALALAIALAPLWFGTALPLALRLGIGLLCLGSAVWLLRRRAT